MTGCWWPCCSEDSYNIIKYDHDGVSAWTSVINNGHPLSQIATLNSQYLYSMVLFTGGQAGYIIAKYDVTSTPSLVWGKTISQIKAIRPEATTFYPVRFAIDGSGNVICLMRYVKTGPLLQGTLFAIKLRSSDGELLWQRELSHTIASTGQKIYWQPGDLTCDTSGNSYYACSGVRLEKSGPTLALWQYINLVALNSDSSLKWQASSDVAEYVPGYPATYQPPNLYSVDTDGTSVYWGCNASASGVSSSHMASIGANSCSSGAAVWSGEVRKWSWPVIVNSNAIDSVIQLHYETQSMKTRSATTGVLADTVSPSVGSVFVPVAGETTFNTGIFSGRRAAGAVARLALIERFSSGWVASIWEDIQAGASVYAKVHTLDHASPLCVAYQHTAAPNDNMFVGGELVTP